MLHNFENQIIFLREMSIQRSLSNSRLGNNFIDANVLSALLIKELRCYF